MCIATCNGSWTALEKKGTFVVANDGTVDHYQRFLYPAWDEKGRQRDFSGWLTNVNKPLMAAGEVSKAMDSYLHDDGGVLMDRNGKIAQGMRREFNRLKKRYGNRELVNLNKENGTYHFGMQTDQAKSYSLHGLLKRPYPHPYRGNARQEKTP